MIYLNGRILRKDYTIGSTWGKAMGREENKGKTERGESLDLQNVMENNENKIGLWVQTIPKL